jgi:hypothetical protein
LTEHNADANSTSTFSITSPGEDSSNYAYLVNAVGPPTRGSGLSRVDLAQQIQVCPGYHYSASVGYKITSSAQDDSYIALVIYNTAGVELFHDSITVNTVAMNVWATFTYTFSIPANIHSIWFSIAAIEGNGLTLSMLIDNASLSAS